MGAAHSAGVLKGVSGALEFAGSRSSLRFCSGLQAALCSEHASCHVPWPRQESAARLHSDTSGRLRHPSSSSRRRVRSVAVAFVPFFVLLASGIPSALGLRVSGAGLENRYGRFRPSRVRIPPSPLQRRNRTICWAIGRRRTSCGWPTSGQPRPAYDGSRGSSFPQPFPQHGRTPETGVPVSAPAPRGDGAGA